MQFSTSLLRGVLVRRTKRFMADVVLDDGREVIAHCPNSGSMLGCVQAGAEVWLSPADRPDRKLKYTWELIRVGDTLVGINTAHPNALVAEAVAAGVMPELAGYDTTRREVRYGANSRIDLLLEGEGRPRCYVEVKNVTLKRAPGAGGAAEFPDAVTSRGTKHLRALADRVAAGERAVMVFLVQRDDCDRFTIAADIDPTYHATFAAATGAGVEAVCYACAMDTAGITVARPLPIHP